MNILITGCLGQLGNELRLRADIDAPEHNFIYTDKDELDICDPDAIRKMVEEEEVEMLINCAAFTAVDKAESEPDFCDLLNHKAPRFLAEAMAEVGGSMIQVSTDYVFDGTGCTPYREDAPCNPTSVYGRTKLLGEEAVREACPQSAVVRTAWLYSRFGGNFVKTMLRLGRERSELGVVADQIGTPTNARDLAGALLTIATKGVKPGIYHYTNEGVCSWYDFTCEIHRLAGITPEQCRVRPIHTEDYPTPAARPHYSVLDKSKIKATYGIDIPWWPETLKDCVKDLLAKEA